MPSDQKTKKPQKYIIKPYEFESFANLEKDRFPYFLRKTKRIPYENLAKTKDMVQKGALELSQNLIKPCKNKENQ